MPDPLYKITLEVVAADREHAARLLLNIVNEGNDILKQFSTGPLWLSYGGASGNGVIRGDVFTPPQPPAS